MEELAYIVIPEKTTKKKKKKKEKRRITRQTDTHQTQESVKIETLQEKPMYHQPIDKTYLEHETKLWLRLIIQANLVLLA